MIAYGTTPLTAMVLANRVIALTDGSGDYVVELPNGNILSCQPDGHFAERPPNTMGPWERCKVNGNRLTFNPGPVYSFAFDPQVPNG